MIPQSTAGRSAQPSSPTIQWLELPARPPMELPPTDRHASRLGAAVAVGICIFITWAGWLISPSDGFVVGLLGRPGTAFLAWRAAPASIEATAVAALSRAIGLTIGTILVADALAVWAIALAGLASPGSSGDLLIRLGQTVGVSVLLFVAGALVIGIPISVIVVPAALVWVLSGRWLATRGWAR